MSDRHYPSPSPDHVAAALGKTHEVFPGLRIGAAAHCQFSKGQGYVSVSVRHVPCMNDDCTQRHYLDLATWVASVEGLDAFADDVGERLALGRKVFVHCAHGIERAPLAVAYFLKRDVCRALPFEDVYAFVRKMRPVALDRTKWLSPEAVRKVGLS